MISKRISLIAEIVPKEYPIADIGSDHGHLLYLLRKSGFSKTLFAVENKIGPYNHLLENISKFKLNNIKTSLSDGLSNLKSDIKTVVIAGMGFDTIKKIIMDNLKRLDSIEYFVIDSHTNFSEVRPFFKKIGYFVENEVCLFENNIYYEIIVFSKKKKNHSDFELKYGPLFLKNKPIDFINYYKKEISKLDKILNIKSLDESKRILVKNEIKEIRSFL